MRCVRTSCLSTAGDDCDEELFSWLFGGINKLLMTICFVSWFCGLYYPLSEQNGVLPQALAEDG